MLQNGIYYTKQHVRVSMYNKNVGGLEFCISYKKNYEKLIIIKTTGSVIKKQLK